MRIFLFIALIMIPFIPAFAQGMVAECGAPRTEHADTENVADYCDIHSRRLAYEEDQKKFHDELRTRQKNFTAPRTEAYNNYLKNLDALRKTTGDNTGNQ
jgi:hypothetical protein